MFVLLGALILFSSGAYAENSAQDIMDKVDLSGFETFAEEHQLDFSAEEAIDMLADSDIPSWQDWLDLLLTKIREPAEALLQTGTEMLFPVLMLALMGVMLSSGMNGAGFICRLMLGGSGLKLAGIVLAAAEECLKTTAGFSDAAAPVLTAVLTAAGRTGSSALVSPAAAMAGNMIGQLFVAYGLPLCRCTACLALAGNMSECMDMNRLLRLIRKVFGWGTGLAITLFTALVFLRGGAASVNDNLALRTAKYAVDSVSPVIGSGVSDAWEAYLSGLTAVRSVVGFSGVILLLSVCLKPMLTMAVAMIGLSLFASLVEMTGEKSAARALEQLSSVCQMTLTLCGGAMAVWVILMGSLLSIGGSFI